MVSSTIPNLCAVSAPPSGMRTRPGPGSITSPPPGPTTRTSFIIGSSVLLQVRYRHERYLLSGEGTRIGGGAGHGRSEQPEAAHAHGDRAGRGRAEPDRPRGEHVRGRPGRPRVRGD